MAEVKMWSVAVATNWMVMHMNRETVIALSEMPGKYVYQDIRNDLQHFLFASKEELDKAYVILERLGANPVKLETPLYVDERWLKK